MRDWPWGVILLVVGYFAMLTLLAVYFIRLMESSPVSP